MSRIQLINTNSTKYLHPGDVIEGICADDLRGVKVLVINLPIREQATPNNPPLGPAFLIARLKQYGVETKMIDLNAYRIKDKLAEQRGLQNGRVLTTDETEKMLTDFFKKYGEYDLIALSGLITTLSWQQQVASIVRKMLPAALIVTGGGLATEFREILFKWIPELNGIAHSEGEDVIVKMAYDANLIKRKGRKSAINSGKLAPYLIGEYNNEPLFQYDGDRPRDLDNLALPDWSSLEEDVYGNNVLEWYINTPVWGTDANNSSGTSFTMNRSLSMISSRGCPFACKFCFRGAQGERNYGVRSAESMIAEFKHIHNTYNIDFVAILDDNFMVQPKRIVDLAEKIQPFLLESGMRWGTHGRLDEAADLRPGNKSREQTKNKILRVEEMKKAGCAYIGFGAESASSRVLDEMGKGGFILSNGVSKVNDFEFPVTMLEGVKNTWNAGIHANCTWIMGYPTETLKDLKTTVAFIKWQEELYTKGVSSGTKEYKNLYDSVNKHLFVASAYPGTEMFKLPTVQKKLTQAFGVQFDKVTKQPIPDQSFYKYVTELDDATKVISGDGGVLNYSDMDDETFFQARKHIEDGNIDKVLDMP